MAHFVFKCNKEDYLSLSVCNVCSASDPLSHDHTHRDVVVLAICWLVLIFVCLINKQHDMQYMESVIIVFITLQNQSAPSQMTIVYGHTVSMPATEADYSVNHGISSLLRSI